MPAPANDTGNPTCDDIHADDDIFISTVSDEALEGIVLQPANLYCTMMSVQTALNTCGTCS